MCRRTKLHTQDQWRATCNANNPTRHTDSQKWRPPHSCLFIPQRTKQPPPPRPPLPGGRKYLMTSPVPIMAIIRTRPRRSVVKFNFVFHELLFSFWHHSFSPIILLHRFHLGFRQSVHQYRNNDSHCRKFYAICMPSKFSLKTRAFQ